MLIKDAPVTYLPPLSKHHPDVLKPTLTNKNQTYKYTDVHTSRNYT